MNLDNIRYKHIHERGYIFDSRTGDVHLLNETASIIVEGILTNNLDKCIDKILNEYEIDEDTLRKDVVDIRSALEELCEK